MAEPITDAERRRIRELHSDGHGCNAIARELGRSPGAISKAAKDLGLSFDRAATATAAAATLATAKAKRAALMHGLLEDAERLRRQLFAPTTLHSFGGKDHTYETAEIPEPLFVDKRNIMQSVSTAVTASVRLAEHDAGSDSEGGKSMLGALAAGLRVAYEQLQDAPDTPAGP